MKIDLEKMGLKIEIDSHSKFESIFRDLSEVFVVHALKEDYEFVVDEMRKYFADGLGGVEDFEENLRLKVAIETLLKYWCSQNDYDSWLETRNNI